MENIIVDNYKSKKNISNINNTPRYKPLQAKTQVHSLVVLSFWVLTFLASCRFWYFRCTRKLTRNNRCEPVWHREIPVIQSLFSLIAFVSCARGNTHAWAPNVARAQSSAWRMRDGGYYLGALCTESVLHFSARYYKQIFYHHLSPVEGQEKCRGREGADYMKDDTLKNAHAQPVYSCTRYWWNISVEFVCNADKIASGTTGMALISAPQCRIYKCPFAATG